MGDQNKGKTASSAKPSQSAFGLVDILLIVAIGGVFFMTCTVRQKIQSTSLEVNTLSAPLSDEPLQVSNNKRCPHAGEDYQSCMQKFQRCKDTELEFSKAEKQFSKLIQDCASSNDENQKINIEMEQELKKLEQHLKKIERK